MANCYIAYPNRVDSTATFSGGSWVSTLPASNMGTRPLKQVARSTDTDVNSTKFTVRLSDQRPIKTLSIINMNLSMSATVQFKVYTGITDSVLAYDSGAVPAYPGGTAAFGTIQWGSDRWWGGLPSAEDAKLFNNNTIHVLPDVVIGNKVDVLITDTANFQGFVQIGRMFVGDGWSPDFNMSYGASIGYESRTAVEEVRSGAEYFDIQAGHRTVQFKLDHLDRSEAFGRLFDIQKSVDVHGEVLFLWDMDDPTYVSRTSFLGRLRKLDPIEQPYYDKFSTSFEIKELL